MSNSSQPVIGFIMDDADVFSTETTANKIMRIKSYLGNGISDADVELIGNPPEFVFNSESDDTDNVSQYAVTLTTSFPTGTPLSTKLSCVQCGDNHYNCDSYITDEDIAFIKLLELNL